MSEEQAVNIFKTSWAYAEMSHLFYRLFFSQDFLEFYNKHFIQTFAETYAKIFIFRTKQANGKAYESLVQALVGSFQAQAELQISINRDEKKFRSTPKYLGNILEVTGLGKVTEVIGYGE